MPKVTEAHREARRRQIALAALACLRRSGVANTSMADIIAESGLSAGAIYSNFRNKAELAAYVARMLISSRADYFTPTEEPRSPSEVAVGMLERLHGEDVPFAVLLQFWAEATTDAEMLESVAGTVAGLHSEISRAIGPWVRLHHPDAVEVMTDRFARAVLAASQGYILNAALFGGSDPRSYFESLSMALSSASSAGN